MGAEQQPSAEPPVFFARGFGKTYGTGDTAAHALRSVDLDVARGEFIVLLGASGSGKSTLLNILGGLDVPSTGELRFAEHQLSGASEAELTRYRREHVGFVFQFYNLIPGPNSSARLSEVQLEARNKQVAWIAMGLSAGTSVVVYPPQGLLDGSRIKAR